MVDSKRILYLTTAFLQKSNSATVRNNSLVKGLIELGNSVDVATILWPDDKRSFFFEQEKNGTFHLFSLKNYDRANSRKKILPGISDKTWLTNFIASFLFFPDVCKDWPSIILKSKIEFSKYDLLVTSSDLKSSHFTGRVIHRQFPRLPWVQIWGDPWYEDIGLPFQHRLLARILEPRLLSCADKIFYVSDITKERMKKLYKEPSNKMFFLPRCYYKEVFSNQSKENTIRLLYPGVLGKGRNLNLFGRVVDEFNQTSPTKIEIQVFSHKSNMSSFKEIKSIKFFEMVDFDEILKVFEFVDGFLFISNCGDSGQIPGKIFDFMGTNLPIICLTDPENKCLNKFLETFERCYIVRNDENVIRAKMNEILCFSKSRFSPEKNFSPAIVAEAFLSKVFS